MSAANWNDRILFARSNLVLPVNRLAERIGYYIDRHPEASREESLLEALPGEVHWREQQEHYEASRCSSTRRPLSAEDIRLHAWLNERLAMLHYERQGLWPKLRRFFFGND